MDVPRVDYEKLTSPEVRRRVEAARVLKHDGFNGTTIQSNPNIRPSEIWNHCQLEEAAQHLAKADMEQLNFSARAYHRTLKLARAIADIVGSEAVTVAHLAKAIQYRHRELHLSVFCWYLLLVGSYTDILPFCSAV